MGRRKGSKNKKIVVLDSSNIESALKHAKRIVEKFETPMPQKYEPGEQPRYTLLLNANNNVYMAKGDTFDDKMILSLDRPKKFTTKGFFTLVDDKGSKTSKAMMFAGQLDRLFQTSMLGNITRSILIKRLSL